MKTLSLIAFVALLVPAYADAQEPILGIRLGQEFQGQFSECQGRRDNWCTLSSLPPGILMPPDTDSPTALPTWIKRDRLSLAPNKDGKVDLFYVTTLGPQVQDRVIDSVSGRFGKPTELDRQVKQTAMGAKFEGVSARWKTDDAVVVHVCTQINACILSFYTPEAYAREMERRKQALQRDKL
jgi:hypothetical protein